MSPDAASVRIDSAIIRRAAIVMRLESLHKGPKNKIAPFLSSMAKAMENYADRVDSAVARADLAILTGQVPEDIEFNYDLYDAAREYLLALDEEVPDGPVGN